MQVAVFTNQFPSKTSTFFSADIKGLMQAGVNVDIFAIYPFDKKLCKFTPEFLSKSDLANCEIYHICRIGVIKCLFSWELIRCLRMIPELTLLLRDAWGCGIRAYLNTVYTILLALIFSGRIKKRYDHIFSYWGNYCATCAYLVHKILKMNIPFTVFIHANMDLYRNRIFLRSKLLYADGIVINSKFNRIFMKRVYPDIYAQMDGKIIDHHEPVDLCGTNCHYERICENRVLAVGRFEKGKGFDILLIAIETLREQGVGVLLDIAGDGERRKEWKRLVRVLDLGECVKFHGWLRPEGVRDLMLCATILVHPSREYGDSVPTVIKEAMALGTPVIASDISGVPELLDYGRCGVLVPPGDILRLANEIRKLLCDSELRKSYAQKARCFAEEEFDMLKNGRCLARRLVLISKRR